MRDEGDELLLCASVPLIRERCLRVREECRAGGPGPGVGAGKVWFRKLESMSDFDESGALPRVVVPALLHLRLKRGGGSVNELVPLMCEVIFSRVVLR